MGFQFINHLLYSGVFNIPKSSSSRFFFNQGMFFSSNSSVGEKKKNFNNSGNQNKSQLSIFDRIYTILGLLKGKFKEILDHLDEYSRINFKICCTSIIAILVMFIFIYINYFNQLRIKIDVKEKVFFDLIQTKYILYAVSMLMVIYILKKTYDLIRWYIVGYYRYSYYFPIGLIMYEIHDKVKKELSSVIFTIFLIFITIALVIFTINLVSHFNSFTVENVNFDTKGMDTVCSFKGFGISIILERFWTGTELTQVIERILSNTCYPGNVEFLVDGNNVDYWSFFSGSPRLEAHRDAFVKAAVSNADGSMSNLFVTISEFQAETNKYIDGKNDLFLNQFWREIFNSSFAWIIYAFTCILVLKNLYGL